MRRVLLAAAIVVAVLAPLLWLPDSHDRGNGVVAPFGTIMNDVTVVSRQDGRVLWSLKTDMANIPEGGSEAFLNDVTVDMPNEGLTVTAEEGLYGLSDGALSLRGGVRAETTQYAITTGSVNLDSESGAITSEDQVVMEGKRYKVQGRGLRALGGKVWLLNDVKAEFF